MLKHSPSEYRSFCLPAILLTFCLLLLSPAAGNTSPLTLSDSPRNSLAGHLEILVDKSGSLSLQDILTAENQTRFKLIPGFVNCSYTNDTVWARMAVVRSPAFPDHSYLRLWPPYLDYLNVYVQTGDDPSLAASYQEFRLGDQIPVKERPLIDADFAVPLTLPKDRPYLVYFRIRTSSTLNLAGDIHTPKDYITYGSFNVARQGGYLAIVLVVSMINMILYLRLWDKLYLYFSLYVFFLFINHFPGSGLMAIFWPSQLHNLSNYMVGGGIGCTLIFFSLFGMRLFESTEKPWVRRFFISMAILAGTTALSVPFGFYNRLAPVLFYTSLASIFLLTWLSFREVARKSEGAFLYLAAFGLSNIGYAVHFLRLLGILPLAWWNMHAVQVASIFNMVLITLAMTERVNRAEKSALQAALESEHKALKLAEEMTNDIMEQQLKLQESLERKTRFVEMVSHEYRTPLAIIRANLDILELQEATQGKGESANIVKMQRAVARLVEVIESSLIRSRLQSDGVNPKQEIVAVADFLADILEEARNLWPGNDLVLEIGSLKTVYVASDPSLLKTSLFNLIDNAVKYSEIADPITISHSASEVEVTIGVADLGPGIPENERQKVLGKFQQGRRSSGKGGRGLGLFLVTKIMQDCGGRLELTANCPQGTVATLVLPRAE